MAVIGSLVFGISIDPEEFRKAMERAKAKAPEKPKGKPAPAGYRPAWLRRLGIVR
jgi:hypothetical protein